MLKVESKHMLSLEGFGLQAKAEDSENGVLRVRDNSETPLESIGVRIVF